MELVYSCKTYLPGHVLLQISYTGLKEWVTHFAEIHAHCKDAASPDVYATFITDRYFCTFHIQEYGMTNVEETQIFIHDALSSKYENGSTTIQTSILQIKHIGKLYSTKLKVEDWQEYTASLISLLEPENCLEEPTPTVYGLYFWPETFPQQIQEMGCYKPTSERAYRLWWDTTSPLVFDQAQ